MISVAVRCRWTVNVRVVTTRDEARLALAVTALGALVLALVLASELVLVLASDHGGSHAFRPGPERWVFASVGAAMALAGLGPWLAWPRRRGHPARLVCGEGFIRAGATNIEATEVTGLSLAHAARGHSVAVTWDARGARGGDGKKRVFFEVERGSDAQRILETLGVARGAPIGMVATPPSRALAIPQAIVSVVALVCGALYFYATLGPEVVGLSYLKPVAGLAGIGVAQLALALLVLRRVLRRQAVALGRGGAWDVHAALHAEVTATPAGVDGVDGDARAGTLARGDETVGAWLQRVDALPSEQHAYRGDALKKDVLWDVLADAAARPDERMAAARVLMRRHGEGEQALVRVVDEPAVRMRVEAALEDPEDAERRIESLGPLFRAR